MPSLGQRLVGELVGTFALVFAGCGAIMVDARSHALGHLGVALSFGLVIAVMISALGHVSGAHFNPAVTAGFALGRHFPRRLVLPYWVAQVAGGVTAALILRESLGSIAGLGATTPSGSAGAGLPLGNPAECVPDARDPGRGHGHRAQGQLAALRSAARWRSTRSSAGRVTGASMNPARSLAPAIAGGPTTALWVYLTAPLLGAAASTVLYRYLSAREPVAVAA